MAQQRYTIVIIQPEGFKHALVFADVARLLWASLTSLGHACQIKVNQCNHASTNILLGYQMLTLSEELRQSPYIVYQLEQLTSWNAEFNEEAIETLRAAHRVWDYSTTNIQILASRGVNNVRHVPIGFHPALQTIKPAIEDVDVLHYGSMNPRRRRILLELEKRCRLVHLFGVYGAQRDAAIARSKIVLNLHIEDEARFEQVRVAYLLTNSKFVISEPGEDNPYGDAVMTVPYDRIAPACLNYLKDDAARQAARVRGHERFARLRMEELLRPALEG